MVAALDHALGRVLRPLANLMPRRLRRAAERIERQRTRPIGQIAAVGFLLATILYGLVVGGQIGRLGDAAARRRRLRHRGRRDHRPQGDLRARHPGEARARRLAGRLRRRRGAGARRRACPGSRARRCGNSIRARCRSRSRSASPSRSGSATARSSSSTATGTEIVPLEESRFAQAALHGRRAAPTRRPPTSSPTSRREPDIAAQMRAAVLVAGRRWDLHLENGVTVKLPEKNVRAALAQLVKLERRAAAPRARRDRRRSPPARPRHRAAAGRPLAGGRDLRRRRRPQRRKART